MHVTYVSLRTVDKNIPVLSPSNLILLKENVTGGWVNDFLTSLNTGLRLLSFLVDISMHD